MQQQQQQKQQRTTNCILNDRHAYLKYDKNYSTFIDRQAARESVREVFETQGVRLLKANNHNWGPVEQAWAPQAESVSAVHWSGCLLKITDWVRDVQEVRIKF